MSNLQWRKTGFGETAEGRTGTFTIRVSFFSWHDLLEFPDGRFMKCFGRDHARSEAQRYEHETLARNTTVNQYYYVRVGSNHEIDGPYNCVDARSLAKRLAGENPVKIVYVLSTSDAYLSPAEDLDVCDITVNRRGW